MRHLKLIFSLAIIVCTLSIAVTGLVKAQAFKSDSKGTISIQRLNNESQFLAANKINIAGTVNGDVFCVGRTVNISGIVNGDVFCVGQTINISGRLFGSARLVGQKIVFDGQVAESLSMAGSEMTVGHTAFIGRDLETAGSKLTLDGTVKRDIAGAAKDINISGKIGRNARLTVNNLNIVNSAHIAGNLHYRSNNQAAVAVGTVSGQITRTAVHQHKYHRLALVFILSYLYCLIGFLIIGILAVLLFPRPLLIAIRKSEQQPLKTLGIGLALVVVLPIVIVLIMATIIGIPLAIILWLMYLMIVILSGPLFAYFAGDKILPEQRPWIQTLVGSLLLLVLLVIPIINILFGLIMLFYGSGIILNLLRDINGKLLKLPGKSD